MVKPPIQTPPAQDLFDPMGALEVTREAQPVICQVYVTFI